MDRQRLSPAEGASHSHFSVEKPIPATFSDAIDAIGMGRFQNRLLLLCGMGWLIDAVEVLVVAFVLDDVAVTFQLDSFDKGLVGSASFFGMSFGAVFWSVYADKHGRRNAFFLTLSVVFLAGLASALVPSFRLLLVSRAVVGFGVGGNLPVSVALVTEFLPTKQRASALGYMNGLFWGAGIVCASLLGLVLSSVLGPGREEAMWRGFLGVAAVPALVVLLFSRYLPESPRYLSVVGRHDDAGKVLEEVAETNGKLDVLGLDPSDRRGKGQGAMLHFGQASDDPTSPPKPVFRLRAPDGEDQRDEPITASSGEFYGRRDKAESAQAGNVRELFHTPILRRVTLCIWMVWLFANTSYYGLTFVLPKYYESIASTGGFVYIVSAVLGLFFASATFLVVWLCSEDRLGRVGTLKWSSLATAVLILLMALSYGTTALFVPLSALTILAIAVPSITKYVITPELYTTKYRAVGLGSASVWTRIGGMLAPVLAEVLYDKGPVWPLAVFCPIMLLVAIFAGLIPVETAGRQLDDDSWDRIPTSPDNNDLVDWLDGRNGDEGKTDPEYGGGYERKVA